MMSLPEGYGQELEADRGPPGSPGSFLHCPAPGRGGQRGSLLRNDSQARATEQASRSLLALHGGTSKSSSLPAYGRPTLSRVRSQTAREACACGVP